MMRPLQLVALLFTMILVLTGCQTQRAWVYNSSVQNPHPTPLCPKKAVVLSYQDQRSNANVNRIGFYAIPILPGFGWANYAAPEGAQMHITSGLWINYNPKEDFPKALAQELSAANLFKEAYFDFKKGDADYVISGQILNTDYSGTIISYGLSAYGSMLWMLGLPFGAVSNDLSVTLTCTEQATGKLLLSRSYKAPHYGKVGWIYSMPNDFSYPDLLKNVYQQFLKDLEPALSQQAAAVQVSQSGK